MRAIDVLLVALKVKQNPSKMLSAILIGNNLVNNFAASLTTALAIKLFGTGCPRYRELRY